jgi:hypothetical protein
VLGGKACSGKKTWWTAQTRTLQANPSCVPSTHSYANLMLYGSMAFMTSLFLVMLLIHDVFYRTPWRMSRPRVDCAV